jgi:hypothetical protein
MWQYKANLGLLASRYGEVERRVIEYFAENPGERVVYLAGGALSETRAATSITAGHAHGGPSF